MKKICFVQVVQNCRKNAWLLVSTMAAVCLYLDLSLIKIVISFFVLAVAFFASAFDVAKPKYKPFHNLKIGRILLTVMLALAGFVKFNATWTSVYEVYILAQRLGVNSAVLLYGVGAMGSITSIYAMYTLSCWIELVFTKVLKENLLVQQKTELLANLRRNWYFPISALAFFCLSTTLSLGYVIGLLIAFLMAMLISTQIPSIWEMTKNSNIVLRLISLGTAIGICFAAQALFYNAWIESSKIQALNAMIPIAVNFPIIISILAAAISFFFVYCCVLAFWNNITEILRKHKIFDEIRTFEWIIYGVMFILTLSFMVYSLSQSQAFYGTEHPYDIIYTSDSPYLVKGNVYLSLTNPENDLRQPLFAVFSAPFAGIPYLLARLIGAPASTQAILINSIQVLLLFISNLILAKMLRLDAIKRTCFMMLSACTYTQLLFTLMMEQYVVAFFWLILCMYLIVEKQQPDRIVLWGAGGTLLTSMILLPFMSTESPIKSFKDWFWDMVKYGMEFVTLILFFCRFDVIFSMISKITQLSRFTGKTVTLVDKIYQYTEFISNCFLAPNAGVNTTAVDYVSWQLDVATDISFVGIIILVLAIISTIWNRDKKSSLLAAGWAAFSVVMLLGLGWGTLENGLILYALYFGWAFLVLLFQLVEKVEMKLNIRFLIPAFTVCIVVALLIINIPEIMEMLNFAITYYPV